MYVRRLGPRFLTVISDLPVVKRIAVVSLFPEMFFAIEHFGITRRAIEKDLLCLSCFNPRDFTEDKHQTVDGRPYGGGPGMVMMIEPLVKATQAARQWLLDAGADANKIHVIYMSPQGATLNHRSVAQMAGMDSLVLIAGRYEGVDERFIESEVDYEISIGDYVLSGGELPAMILIDAIIRLVPGALGDADSADQDSFVNGLLDFPQYTRPEEYMGLKVPKVLLSGDHKKIRLWRQKQSLGRTWEKRPDLLDEIQLDSASSMLLDAYRAEKQIEE